MLEVALAARILDVGASPYDATAYGAGIVPVETNEGRKMFRDQQFELMGRADPVRRRMLEAYKILAGLACGEEALSPAGNDGRPWSKGDASPTAVIVGGGNRQRGS